MSNDVVLVGGSDGATYGDVTQMRYGGKLVRIGT